VEHTSLLKKETTMKRILTVAGALVAFAVTMSAASASTLPVYGQQSPSVEAGFVPVHSVHRSCELGYRGWHRSTPWGERVWCRPRGEHHGYYERRRHGDRYGSRGHRGSHDGDGDYRGRGGDRDGRGYRSNYDPSHNGSRTGTYDL
jgi:hypothetical protein